MRSCGGQAGGGGGGGHTRTNEALRTGPTAEPTTMTRHILVAGRSGDCPGPVRKPMQDGMSQGGGGGALDYGRYVTQGDHPRATWASVHTEGQKALLYQ